MKSKKANAELNNGITKKKQIIGIVLKSYDNSVLDNAVEKVVALVKQERLYFQGPIPLPNKKTLFTVLTSPHIDVNAKTHYCQIESKRVIFIAVNDNFINAVSKIDLPSGVHVKIKMHNEKKENK